MADLWEKCREHLKEELSVQEFNQWITPLQVEVEGESNGLRIHAPNRFVLEKVIANYQDVIERYLEGQPISPSPVVRFGVGEVAREETEKRPSRTAEKPQLFESNLNREFNFDTFIEGKSNQIARSAAIQIADHPGTVFNPLFIYGGVGLGKTHLMHAVGNRILENNRSGRALYIHSEKFVNDMVRAIQSNQIDGFKRKYRSVNLLLIDDIQFFAGKERSQEEFFHTFNSLFETRQQIILTSDRLPKEVSGLEDRLISRFGWGLTVSIEPPDLETRVAILQNKAEQYIGAALKPEVAFFIAKRIKANIRELEGALRLIKVHAEFSGETISVEFAHRALRDLLAVQETIVTIDQIIKVVAEYFQIRVSDILSKRRSRSIARPRQFAMTLAKELTDKSLSDIGEGFGGRDHTTVLYAIRKVEELKEGDPKTREDYSNLVRTLSI